MRPLSCLADLHLLDYEVPQREIETLVIILCKMVGMMPKAPVKPLRTTPVRFRQPVRPGSAALVAAGYIMNKAGGLFTRTWDKYAILLILEGGGIYKDVKNGSRTVKAGDLLVLFPELEHSYYKEGFPIWSECFLTFEGNVFRQLESDGLISRDQPVLSPGLAPSIVTAFDRIIRDYLSDAPEPDAIIAGRIHLLIAEVVHHHQRATERAGGDFLKQACALLEGNLEQELDLKDVARAFHLSYERFRKRFTQEAGTSPARYRNLRRIDLAKSLLTEARLPVKEVSERLGYCDVYYFSRQFKLLTGVTPVQFRRSV